MTKPSKPRSTAPIPLSLALQGGGAHGAFAWGALDQLLLDGRADIKAISAVSGGAMSAVVLADGLSKGGREHARNQLQKFWKKVSVAASMLPIRTSMMDKMLSQVGLDFSASSLALDTLTRVFSPYQFNLFDLNPLKGILEELVDFDALRKNKDIALFVAATHALSGESRIFTTKDVTLEVVMASACLPFIFKTAMIAGEPYWDGSFTANPALTPLAHGDFPPHIALIQTITPHTEEAPTQASDILDHATEISFHNALKQELSLLAATHKNVQISTIQANDMLGSLGRASKLNAEWDFLVYLHDLGVQAATDWLDSL